MQKLRRVDFRSCTGKQGFSAEGPMGSLVMQEDSKGLRTLEMVETFPPRGEIPEAR